MKLFFDARYIRTDYHDGISRYSTELAAALAKITPVTFLIYSDAQRHFLPKNAECLTIHKPTSAMEPFTAQLLNRYHPDVVFSPLQTMGTSGRKFKLILTSYDMIYYRRRTPPSNFNAAIRAGWWLYHQSYVPQRLALNSADMVVTISEDTKVAFTKARLTKRPIVVVPPAPQDLASLHDRPDLQDAPRNLVYMGSFMPYKNVETLIAAMQWLPGRTLHLLSRISPARKATLSALIPGGAKVIFHNGVSDQEYARLLADNAVLVTASFDEGYGLPVADALAFGTPAVVSDIPIFHEVAGDGALYFNPDQPDALAAAIKQLDQASERKALVSRGRQHIKQFSWPHAAKLLLGAIKSLL